MEVTDPGFGSYWTVNLSAPPGTKRPRKRGRPIKEGPPKKKGRPRKSPLADDHMCSLLKDDEEYNHHLHNPESLASTSRLIQNGWTSRIEEYGDRQEYEDESEEECESEEEIIHPMDRRDTLAAIGLSAYRPSRPTQPFSLPPFSTLRNSDSILDSLHAEIATLRRQSADAVSLSLRLSEQLVQAQTETSRTRATLQAVEELLEQESERRRELERMLDNEKGRRNIERDPGALS
ncbi:hypothetical protein C0991_007585 [Blastosporella zonata]|nr:hypothetical protein C0991_007585 [Blastosporella zonata]